MNARNFSYPPAGWRSVQLKHVVSCNDDTLDERQSAETLIRYVDISSVEYGKGIISHEEISFADAPSRARRVARAGDVLVSTVRTYLKAIAPVGEEHSDCIFSTGFAILRSRSQHLTPEYLKWLMLNENLIQRIVAHSEGLSYPAINPSLLINLKVTVPQLVEQRGIAAFLDCETARIDNLIDRKYRFLSLLREKQIAMITAAVVSGLRPNTPKRAMIPWIPESPAHWTVIPLSAIASRDGGLFIDGDWIESKDLADEGIRYITTGNVGRGIYKEQGTGFISEDTFRRLNCTEVLPGDILVSRLNSPIARACVMPDLNSRVVTSVDNVIVRPSPAYDRRFLVYLFSSAPHFFNTENLARGTTMQRISRSALGRIRFAVPDLAEQMEIADHLDGEVSKIQRLIAKTERSVELLKEHRSAIITAAVTGKIDVRGLAAKNMKAAA